MADALSARGTVMIRRKGTTVLVEPVTNPLQTDLLSLPATDTILARDLEVMAERLAVNGERILPSVYELNGPQQSVFADMAKYVRACFIHRQNGEIEPFGRVVLPPRTGKTVLMGEAIAATGATALILVPAIDLVQQHRDELSKQLPWADVGIYYGKEKTVARITIATYQSVQARHKAGTLPEALRHVHFVFSDEAHEGMTPDRMAVQNDACFPSAVRIAFTATPDYNEDRVLADHFPRLVHELTAWEAEQLKLLAPAKVWVRLVDEGASQTVVDKRRLPVRGGEYDPDELGKILALGPFLKACAEERFNPIHVGRSALICCTSRFQARQQLAYFLEHHAGEGSYGLIIDETPSTERSRLREAFDRGEVDTLINVGILLRGWNSPRCKLLVDMALSLSRVRSTQKFYRPRTKDGDAEAHIVVLAPKGLEYVPFLPNDVFGTTNREESFPNEWEKRPHGRPESKGPRPRRRSAIKNVDLVSELIVDGERVGLGLNPQDDEQIAEVVKTVYPDAATYGPSWYGFQRQRFDHELFFGSGLRLLRYCGVRPRYQSFHRFLFRLFPDQRGSEYLGPDASLFGDLPTEDDVTHLLTAGGRKKLGPQSLHDWETGFLALSAMEFIAPDEACTQRELATRVRDILGTLTPREEKIIRMRFGIGYRSDHTLDEVGQEFEVTRERIHQVETKAMRKLRHPARSQFVRAFVGDDSSDPVPPPKNWRPCIDQEFILTVSEVRIFTKAYADHHRDATCLPRPLLYALQKWGVLGTDFRLPSGSLRYTRIVIVPDGTALKGRWRPLPPEKWQLRNDRDWKLGILAQLKALKVATEEDMQLFS